MWKAENVIQLIQNYSQWEMQGFVAGIGPVHDPVTWYGINYAGTQIMQCDFQNKGSFSSLAQSKGKAATVAHFDNFSMAL